MRDFKDNIFRPLVKVTPTWLCPNLITTIRLGLGLVLWVCWWWLITNSFFAWQPRYWWLLGGLIFFGPFTDFWDGAVARLKDKITTFGIYFDPIVDKFFSLPVFLLFLWQWPWLSSLYWLIALRIFLIILTLVKAVFHQRPRYSRFFQLVYLIISFIGYFIFMLKLLADL